MIRSILGKVVTGAAMAGLLALPSAGTVAPLIANTDHGYPHCAYYRDVATKTDVKLAKSFVRYGEKNTATITVTSGQRSAPDGVVVFQVGSRDPVQKKLTNGKATFSMPTNLARGKTLPAKANYRANCRYKASSDTAYVTVMK